MYRIYYGDGSMFTQGDGIPPARDVQVIVQEHSDVGWHTQSRYDYYIWMDGRYVGVDLFGLYDWLLERGDVLFGRTMTRRVFDRVMAQAVADMGEAKTGWLPDERWPNG